MDQNVDIKQALRVFQRILDEGKRDGDEYEFHGLRARVGFDGYTATLLNDYVTLTIQFHNKYMLDCLNEKEKEQFLEKLEQLDHTQAEE